MTTIETEIQQATVRMPVSIEEMHERDAKTRGERIAWVLMMVEPGDEKGAHPKNGMKMGTVEFAAQGFWGLA